MLIFEDAEVGQSKKHEKTKQIWNSDYACGGMKEAKATSVISYVIYTTIAFLISF